MYCAWVPAEAAHLTFWYFLGMVSTSLILQVDYEVLCVDRSDESLDGPHTKSPMEDLLCLHTSCLVPVICLLFDDPVSSGLYTPEPLPCTYFPAFVEDLPVDELEDALMR